MKWIYHPHYFTKIINSIICSKCNRNDKQCEKQAVDKKIKVTLLLIGCLITADYPVTNGISKSIMN